LLHGRRFTGNFLNNELIYADFLDRPTTEIAGIYTGKNEVYLAGAETCVTMPEIDALYSASSGSNTLENEWTVSKVFVTKNRLLTEVGELSTLPQLREYFGEPVYFGAAWVDLAEAVGFNTVAKDHPDQLSSVEMVSRMGLEDVWNVSDYDRDYQFYLYTFEKDGLLYSFYFPAAGQSEFVMYALEVF